MLWLQNPGGVVRAATIHYEAHNDVYRLAVTTIYGGYPNDGYKTEVAARRDFGKKFLKGGKWGKEFPGTGRT